MPESVSPQLQETGTLSKESSAKSKRSREKFSNLASMIGWKSIRRTMKREDDLANRDARAYHELLHGDRGGDSSGKSKGDEEMGHMVLGDMITHNHFPEKKGIGPLVKLAIGSVLVGSGAGAVVGVPILMDFLKPDSVVTETIKDFRVGTPILEE